MGDGSLNYDKSKDEINWLKKSHTGDGYVETEALSTDEQYKKKGTNISFREFDKERIGLIVTALKRR